MNITFLLPKYFNEPSGGYKVVFEYANHFVRRGHKVTVVLPRDEFPRSTAYKRLKSRFWIYLVKRKTRPIMTWFPLDPRVRMTLPLDLRPQFIPDADIIVATSWETAEWAQHYSHSKGIPFYNVYDYERYMIVDAETRNRMGATYRAGLNMIATSPAVLEMMTENGGKPTAYIPCGLDLSVYKLEAPIATRQAGRIGLQLRANPTKGTVDAINAATQLKQSHGEALHFVAFGHETDAIVPDWVERLEAPTDTELRAFYNSLSIFMFPSHYEGWGLPGCEALACGAALATTDSVGNREYAIDGKTALVVPRQRPDLLAQAVETLFRDEDLRQGLAQQGHDHVQQYTWARAVDALELAFKAKLEPSG